MLTGWGGVGPQQQGLSYAQQRFSGSGLLCLGRCVCTPARVHMHLAECSPRSRSQAVFGGASC